MDTAMLWLTIVLACAAVASAVFAYVQARAATESLRDARAARDESRAARDEAAALAEKATDAFVRQAEALEESNELTKKAMPPDGARWELQHVRKMKYVLVNNGNATAEGATLTDITNPPGWVRHSHSEPKDVAQGDVLEFLALAASGSPNPRVRVSWRERDGELLTHDVVVVT